jgi:hypothetical protein
LIAAFLTRWRRTGRLGGERKSMIKFRSSLAQ